jgi:hypothetical protein
MNRNISREFDALPPDAQKQVLDFIAFLGERYKTRYPTRKKSAKNISEEPFIGIWQDRQDMADSVKWVREKRESEWDK